MKNTFRLHNLLSLIIVGAISSTCLAENKSGSLDSLISEIKTTDNKDKASEKNEIIKLNPENDYVRNAEQLSLPATQQIEFVIGAKQAAFLIPAPTNKSTLWKIKLSTDSPIALVVKLRTITFDEHGRLIESELLFEEKSLGSIEVSPRLWPDEETYLLIGSSSPASVKLSIESVENLPPLDVKGYANGFKAISTDVVSKPFSLKMNITDPKLTDSFWELNFNAAPNSHYQIQIRRNGYPVLTAITDKANHISVKNLRLSHDKIEFFIRPLKKRFSPVAISMLPMKGTNNFTEEEQAKFTPLIFDETMRGDLSYVVSKNRVEIDSWQIDLSKVKATNSAMPQVEVSIFADNPADHLSASLVEVNRGKKLVDVERRSEITLDSLSLAPGKYTLKISSKDVGVGYSIRAKLRTEDSRSQDQEPNNSRERANQILPRRPVKGKLSELDQEDYFVIDTSASGAAQMWRILSAGKGIKSLTIDDKFTALFNPQAPNRPVSFKQLKLLPGKHYIKAEGSGNYTLRAIPLGPPKEGFEVEPNDGIFGPFQHLKVGKQMMGSLEQIRYGDTLDQDNYRFTVEEEALYKLTITPPEDKGIHVKLKMYDAVWFDADLETDAATPIIYESRLFSGDFTLAIQNIKNQIALDEYTVLLEKITPNNLTEDNLTKENADIEPNDRLGLSSLLTKSQTINGSLGHFDEIDNFQLPPSEAVTKIKVLAINKESDFKAKLFSSLDRKIPVKKIDANTWEVPAHESEVYFSLQIAAANKKNISHTVNYQMNIEMAASKIPNKDYIQGLKQFPEQLYKNINVAWGALGAQWETTNKNTLTPKVNEKALRSLATLNDYLMPHGLGAGWKYKQSADLFRLKLAGDKPSQLTGIAVNTRMISDPRYKVRHFDFFVSSDGNIFNKVLSGELDSSHKTQYFPFDKTVTARYVQLIPTQNFTGKLIPNRMKLQELLVFAEKPSLSSNMDLASQKLGGHTVYQTFSGFRIIKSPLDKTLFDFGVNIDVRKNSLCKFAKKQNQAEWVIGFHHNRTAKIEKVKYVPNRGDLKLKHFDKLDIQISMESPAGPWTPIGHWSEQQLSQTQEIELSQLPWVKFIRFIAHGEANKSYQCPGDLIVNEAKNLGSYQTILAEWKGVTSDGPYEESHPTVKVDYLPKGGKDKENATKLVSEKLISSSVKRERNEDWFQFNKTADNSKNSLIIHLSHPISFKPTLHVFDHNEKQLQLKAADKEQENNLNVTKSEDLPFGWTQSYYLTGLTESGSYQIRVQEPLRNTIIAWDSSGSMRKQLPYIHSSVEKWSEYIKPEHEQVKILTLNGKPFPEKNWANYPYMLQAALELARDNPNRTDNVETALIDAGKLLSSESGNHAVVITSDGINPGNIEFWTSFTQQCPQLYSVGMGGGHDPVINSTDSQFSHWQDKFQDWVSVCGGKYQYCDSFQCLEDFYEYAANDIRKSKPYQLQIEQSFVKPAVPVSVSVTLGNRSQRVTKKALYVILDASGSMLGRVDGKRRIDVAKSTLKKIVKSSIGKQNHFALRTFGLKSNSCNHALTIPLKKLNITRAEAAIDGIEAINLAKTPIADSLVAAAKDLDRFKGQKLVILLTDGEETCDGDSESVLRTLRASGLDIKMYIVGFALDDENLVEQFKSWASLGGGKYYDTQNENDLQTALHQSVTPRFEIKNSLGEVVLSGYIGEKKYQILPGQYMINLPDYPEITPEKLKVLSGQNVAHEFK